ncbi:MAG TPA: heavy metal translocating P-type ATPase [Caldisericia bacterium]|nr:heavy metal translocating P-type ATPase [Caldisericia bacterium]
MIKTVLDLSDLKCQACIKKTIHALSLIPGVHGLNFDKENQVLSLQIDSSRLAQETLKEVRSWIGQNPCQCRIEQKKESPGHAFSLQLEGLHCAVCAAKIEKQVAKIPGVASAQLNIASKKLSITISEKKNSELLLKKIETIVHDLEPEVKVQRSFTGLESPWTFITITKVLRLSLGLSFFVLALFVKSIPLSAGFYFIAYLIFGWQVLLRSIKNIRRGDIFDEYFLMSIATLGAFAIKEYPEAVAVMLFFWLGDQFQQFAVHQSRQSIQSLVKLRPDKVNVLQEGKLISLDAEKVKIGDVFVLKAGDRVAIDGIIVEGSSHLDLSALTGESEPSIAVKGQQVLSGSINLRGLIHVQASKVFQESTMQRIMQLVESASEKKAQSEQLITRLARVYTPLVVLAALFLALVCPWVFPSIPWNIWLYRSFVFLVVSCPCALVISIPLSFFSGLGAASREGILIKGGNYLEALNSVSTILFDKTGTLTHGQFKVSKILPTARFQASEVLYYAALAEKYSLHPFAYPILQAYQNDLPEILPLEYQEIAGRGIILKLNQNEEILVGNIKLLKEHHIEIDDTLQEGTSGAYVAFNGHLAGFIALEDELKPETHGVMAWLRTWKIKHLGLLSGDRKSVANKIAQSLNLDMIHAELMPQDKATIMASLRSKMSKKEKLMFVGDGINDAPVLAQADIGVAMGAWGSDAAIEASDIVLMHQDLRKLPRAFQIARKTRQIIVQNIVFALSVKISVLLLGAFGFASMWEAVFADVGVTLLAVLNSMRILGQRKHNSFQGERNPSHVKKEN